MQSGKVVLHGVYPPTTNTTDVSSEFLLEFLQTYSEARVAEKSKINDWSDAVPLHNYTFTCTVIMHTSEAVCCQLLQ